MCSSDGQRQSLPSPTWLPLSNQSPSPVRCPHHHCSGWLLLSSSLPPSRSPGQPLPHSGTATASQHSLPSRPRLSLTLPLVPHSLLHSAAPGMVLQKPNLDPGRPPAWDHPLTVFSGQSTSSSAWSSMPSPIWSLFTAWGFTCAPFTQPHK